MSLKLSILGLILVCAQSVMAQQAGQPVAEQPKYKAGDFWEYSHTKKYPLASPESPTKYVRKVISDNSNGTFVVDENGKEWTIDSAYNFIDPRGQEYNILENVYPMYVGRPDVKVSRPITGQPGSKQIVILKVVDFETITVPAGKFECFHITLTRETSVKSFAESNPVHKWYCPEIQQIAKAQGTVEQRSNFGPASNYEYVMELTNTNYLKK